MPVCVCVCANTWLNQIDYGLHNVTADNIVQCVYKIPFKQSIQKDLLNLMIFKTSLKFEC